MLLAEFLTHEQQFFALVAEHESIAHTEVGVLIHLVAGHLVDHGALQMYNLVVGQRQNILLSAVVAHREGKSVVVALSHDRIQLHVFAEVVHPAHVPLEGEAKASVLGFRRDLGPCSGLLGDRKEAGMSAVDLGIEMLEELDSVKVLISAVLVGKPLAVLLAVVKVQHGSDSIHADSVDMVLVDPVVDIGDQEVGDLFLRQVEDPGAPVRVLSAARIGIFIDAGAVEFSEPESVGAEVCGHPVEDHADIVLMKCIHQVHEILGMSVSGSGSIVTCHLISPGSVKRMLGNAHELHVRELHDLEILGEAVSKLSVIVKTVRASVGMLHPGTDMALVNCQRLAVGILVGTRLHPARIAPLVTGNVDGTGCCAGAQFRPVSVRIGFILLGSVLRCDAVFVEFAFAESGNEQGPDSACIILRHRMRLFVPSVESSDHVDCLGVRRPDREEDSLLSVFL